VDKGHTSVYLQHLVGPFTSFQVTDEWKNGGMISRKAEMLRGHLFQDNSMHNKSQLICLGIEPEFLRKEAGDLLPNVRHPGKT
jgi:hypothetical protein